jgi:hypothetical protein
MNWTDLIGALPGLLGLLAGSGPYGIAAMVLGGGALYGVVWYFVKKMNEKVDAGDLARGGADAGNTAVDLKNQADANRAYVDQAREVILKAGPPENETKP